MPQRSARQKITRLSLLLGDHRACAKATRDGNYGLGGDGIIGPSPVAVCSSSYGGNKLFDLSLFQLEEKVEVEVGMEKLLQFVKKLLHAGDDLDFLLQMEQKDLEHLVVVIRERVERGGPVKIRSGIHTRQCP